MGVETEMKGWAGNQVWRMIGLCIMGVQMKWMGNWASMTDIVTAYYGCPTEMKGWQIEQVWRPRIMGVGAKKKRKGGQESKYDAYCAPVLWVWEPDEINDTEEVSEYWKGTYAAIRFKAALDAIYHGIIICSWIINKLNILSQSTDW